MKTGKKQVEVMTKMSNLFDIGKDGLEIEAILYENEGELTPELESRLDAHLKGGKEKIEAAVWIVRSLEASAEACEAESKRLKDRASSFINNAKRLETSILWAVDAGFSGKVKTDIFTVWGQTSAATTVFDLAPDADLQKIANETPGLVRTKLELDKQVLKAKHKRGETLPPEILVLENPGTRYLRIL